MSRKTSTVSIDLDANKQARLQLVEARQKLNYAQGRSPSQCSIDGLGSRSPLPKRERNSSKTDNKPRKLSITSTTSLNPSEFKWVNIDGKGNWQKVRIQKTDTPENVQDDFKDEDLAGSKSGEESEQYWAELNAEFEKRESSIRVMVADYIDIPEVILVSEEVSLEHKEQKTSCQVENLEEDLTAPEVNNDPDDISENSDRDDF